MFFNYNRFNLLQSMENIPRGTQILMIPNQTLQIVSFLLNPRMQPLNKCVYTCFVKAFRLFS